MTTTDDWDHFGGGFAPWEYAPKTTPEVKEKSCKHSWKLYEGFMKVYNYCEHCDEKKEV